MFEIAIIGGIAYFLGVMTDPKSIPWFDNFKKRMDNAIDGYVKDPNEREKDEHENNGV